MNRGWISLHRKMTDHWLYTEERTFSRYEAWIDLLLMANHRDNKVIMDSQLVTVKRGTFITSIRKLCRKWDWSNTKVVHFLKMLEVEKMIHVKSDTKKTMITIIEYDTYQQALPGQTTGKRNEDDSKPMEKRTNNNENNVNNENKYRQAETFGKIFSEYQFGF